MTAVGQSPLHRIGSISSHVRGAPIPTEAGETRRLDDEHRSRISDCVWKDDIQLDHQGIIDFVCKIKSSIVAFLKARADARTRRQAHDALRDLWQLSYEEDVPVGQLRARLLYLPKLAFDHLVLRARVMSPKLFDSVDGGFLTWAENADANELVEMIRTLGADGARLVSRGRGKRSRARLEPVIFGQARGDGGGVNTGGRPSQDARDALVMHLAVDWTIATLSRCRAVATMLVSATSCTASFSGSANLPRTRRSDGIGMKSRRAGPDPRPSSSL